jgi:hypothetical protein
MWQGNLEETSRRRKCLPNLLTRKVFGISDFDLSLSAGLFHELPHMAAVKVTAS